MSNIWQGETIRLRALEPSDADAFFEWDLDTEMARFLYRVPFPQSREEVRRWTREGSTKAPENDEVSWVIETLDGVMVGSINTHRCERRYGTFQYGVAVMREHWRKGYASEAIKLVLRYYFGELRYQKVTAEVYEFNEASIKLHERMGFVLEGRLRKMLYTDGKYWDVLVYGMTDEEFNGGQTQAGR